MLASPRVFGPLTRLQCSPTSDGAGAAILANEAFVVKHNLQVCSRELLYFWALLLYALGGSVETFSVSKGHYFYFVDIFLLMWRIWDVAHVTENSCGDYWPGYGNRYTLLLAAKRH